MADDDHESEWSGSLFARVRMVGDDFENGRIPVRSLDEIVRYRALVLRAAAEQWREANEGRDLPEDFEENFDLVLTDVEPGSAVSVLERPSVGIYDNFYDQGRDLVEQDLELAASPSADAEIISLLEYKEFRDFGSSLQDDERIEIRSPETEGQRARVVELTPSTSRHIRERLVPAYKKLTKPERHTEIGWIVGRLTAINADNKNYTIVSDTYGTVNGRYKDEEILADLKAVLGSSEGAPVVRMYGRLRFANTRLERILDITKLQLLEIDGQPWSRRFIELANLEAGWHDDYLDSEVVAFSALDGARNVLLHVLEKGIAQPGIFPTVEGGVSLEWATSRRVTTIEISPDADFELFQMTRGETEPVASVTTVITDVFAFVDGADL
ncbi:hypothetical protein [Mycobacterium sp. 141]|uniref:hypothetical protein n=1 Tax=Mycobacterium sp. 141 TaxID=1120797 RepID=UPI0012DBE05A|nr:hypothetical protein [Mycobacterium sp. 141]